MDCGPTCLKMVAAYYGRNYTIETLRRYSSYANDGVSLLGIAEAAEKTGFRCIGAQLTYQQLKEEAKLPCIIHWGQNHFVVVTDKISNKQVTIADPASGIIKVSRSFFESKWHGATGDTAQGGVALLLEPGADFYQYESEKDKALGWGMLYAYLWSYKKYLLQLVLSLLVGSLLQLIMPFLTQSIVDTGINTHNLQFIYIVLAAQLMLLFSRTVVEFIRSRMLLFISTHINLTILSDFWIKLLKLPVSFFDTAQAGDILQRIGDHQRIQQFLTGNTLASLFSVFNLLVFSIVLATYNGMVFIIFLAGSIGYFAWIRLFLKHRRRIDYQRFGAASKENSATMQLILGMREVKLYNAGRFFRWHWEGLQAVLARLAYKSLSLGQIQQTGAVFFNEGKNILITFFVAKSVLDGHLTIGAMLAVQYMIGQLNSPIEQLVGFVQQAQDAKISLERLNEIHQIENEEPAGTELLRYLPQNGALVFNNVTFTYPGAGNEPVLNGIHLIIPEGKVTAIVGTSGSGKTTLLKLLLRYYDHYQGKITVGGGTYQAGEENKVAHGIHLDTLSPSYWHSQCACVLQDGYIFDETISRNIAIGEEQPELDKLLNACRIANILPFVESLPLGFNTKIGASGNGISSGQKQRILIARAVYKNPRYLFMDEATNSLDANNEKVIMSNLQEFFRGRTVIVVAHRLSTVKNADKIVVLQNGVIVEEGIHEQLSVSKGHYFRLVKNQLELGN